LACSRDQAFKTRSEPLRDDERRLRTRLYRPDTRCGEAPAEPVRIFLIREGAINGFVITGNLMLAWPAFRSPPAPFDRQGNPDVIETARQFAGIATRAADLLKASISEFACPCSRHATKENCP
jgi:hypothetical protein